MKKFFLILAFSLFVSLSLYSKKDDSDISVLILPFEKQYRKENRFLRKFFVEIRNKSLVSMIKYEKVFSVCKKNNINYSLINSSNYSIVTDILKPDILIVPSMHIITNTLYFTNIISVETNINSLESINSMTNGFINIREETNAVSNIDGAENTNSLNNYRVYDKPMFSYTNIKDIRFGYAYTNIITNENILLTNIYTYINNAKLEIVTNINKIYDFKIIDVNTDSLLTNTVATSTTNFASAAGDISSVIMSSMIYMKFNAFWQNGPADKSLDFYIERERDGKAEKIDEDIALNIGDNIIFNFKSEKERYVNIFYFDSESGIRLIFPNDFDEMSDHVLPDTLYTYPNEAYKFKIKIDKYGKNSVFIFTVGKKIKLFDGSYLSGTGFPYISKKTEFIINAEDKIKKLKKRKGVYSIQRYDFECKEPFDFSK